MQCCHEGTRFCASFLCPLLIGFGFVGSAPSISGPTVSQVSDFENNVKTQQSGSGMRFLGFGGFNNVAENKSYVSLDLLIIDTTAGEVFGYTTVEGRSVNTAKIKASGGSLLLLAGLIGGLIGASGLGA